MVVLSRIGEFVVTCVRSIRSLDPIRIIVFVFSQIIAVTYAFVILYESCVNLDLVSDGFIHRTIFKPSVSSTGFICHSKTCYPNLLKNIDRFSITLKWLKLRKCIYQVPGYD